MKYVKEAALFMLLCVVAIIIGLPLILSAPMGEGYSAKPTGPDGLAWRNANGITIIDDGYPPNTNYASWPRVENTNVSLRMQERYGLEWWKSNGITIYDAKHIKLGDLIKQCESNGLTIYPIVWPLPTEAGYSIARFHVLIWNTNEPPHYRIIEVER